MNVQSPIMRENQTSMYFAFSLFMKVRSEKTFGRYGDMSISNGMTIPAKRISMKNG